MGSGRTESPSVRLGCEVLAAAPDVWGRFGPRLGLRLLSLLPTLWPGRFSWAPYPTHVNPSGTGHLRRLLARPGIVEKLARVQGGLDGGTIHEWTKAPGWWVRAAPYLLYE